jgi:hypothetical protein
MELIKKIILKFIENSGATPKLIICIFKEIKKDQENI